LIVYEIKDERNEMNGKVREQTGVDADVDGTGGGLNITFRAGMLMDVASMADIFPFEEFHHSLVYDG